MPLQTHINALESNIHELRMDTSVPAKYRNKAISRIEEAQALLYKAMHEDPNYGAPRPGEASNSPNCICPDGAVDILCPVHSY